jgi:hypothetical protein
MGHRSRRSLGDRRNRKQRQKKRTIAIWIFIGMAPILLTAVGSFLARLPGLAQVVVALQMDRLHTYGKYSLPLGLVGIIGVLILRYCRGENLF